MTCIHTVRIRSGAAFADSFCRKQRQHRASPQPRHKPVARLHAPSSVGRMSVTALSNAPATSPFSELFPPTDTFARRHLGPDATERAQMLGELGYASLDALVDAAVPADIRLPRPLQLPAAAGERAALAELRALAAENQVFRSLIGQGYAGTATPAVIQRTILENPAWYTAYTPYQAEISQGRLEALLNFQTVVTDLTGLDIANASMLDEGTAAAEAMMMAARLHTGSGKAFFVSDRCHPPARDLVRTRARPPGP